MLMFVLVMNVTPANLIDYLLYVILLLMSLHCIANRKKVLSLTQNTGLFLPQLLPTIRVPR